MPIRERTYEQHGMTKTPEYQAWRNMLSRCLNPHGPGFQNWGGRGIRICDEWVASFVTFYQHVGARPGKGFSLDRIDNEGNYEPGNVHWVTAKAQLQNTRSNVFLTFDGETLCLREWQRRTGIDGKVIAERMKAGLPPAECLSPSRRTSSSQKLTPEMVAEIKEALARQVSVQTLAERYGVVPSNIGHIKHGRSWTHVVPPTELYGFSLEPAGAR